MPEGAPIFWPLAELVDAFRQRTLSPVEVTREALARIEGLDGLLHSYLTVTAEPALKQAREAEARYAAGGEPLPPLLGVPVSVKDLFDVRGVATSLGSRVYRGQVAAEDSLPVARLRAAGAVFLGKSNTAEFGQSATTENLLGPACGNPWDPSRTSGGSSGGAAASVGAGLAAAALGSDGGGSIRIPAAMCGLFGVKPTLAPLPDDRSFRAMTDFACPGPIVRCVSDARSVLAAILDRELPLHGRAARYRVAWCPAPERRPVDSAVATAAAAAVRLLEQLGHVVEEVEVLAEGWSEAFGPLVLADEWRYRRQLLTGHAEDLTGYARKSIEAAERLTKDDVRAARALKDELGDRVAALFTEFDFLVTPTTATVAFPIGERPREIAGRSIEPLWGPFPFTAPFNVAGVPAASLPVGLVENLPVGLQIVAPAQAEAALLEVCGQLEEAVQFPTDAMRARWTTARSDRAPAGGRDVVVSRHGPVSVVAINRPRKRNAMTPETLSDLRSALARETANGTRALVLAGSTETFSAGMDLTEIGNGVGDIRVDEAVAETAAAIRALPVPVIAAIEGPCVGAAIELALACDVRVAGRDAYFWLPAARLGLLYRPQAVADLVSELGRQTTARLLVLGERISAADAAETEIAGAVVDAGAALAKAVSLAEGAATGAAPAVLATRELIAELVRGSTEFSSWEDRRRQLLASPERRLAVAKDRQRIGIDAPVAR